MNTTKRKRLEKRGWRVGTADELGFSAKYEAIYQRDATDVWTAKLTAPWGVQGRGETIEKARAELRDTLALWHEDPNAGRVAIFTEEFRFSVAVNRAVAAARVLRQTADDLVERSEVALRAALGELMTKQRVSAKDAAEILGVPFQRVRQVASESGLVEERPAKRKSPRAGKWAHLIPRHAGLDAAHRRIMESSKTATLAEIREGLIRSGIMTTDGELSPHYRTPVRKRRRRS